MPITINCRVGQLGQHMLHECGFTNALQFKTPQQLLSNQQIFVETEHQ